MDYQEALDFMFSQLPMFHRIGAPAYKANLNNTIALSHLTGYPYNKFKSIHIAGTNGKGSVSHMLASILQESGYKTGLFTSPHLVDFRERIKVNGNMIDKSFVSNFINKYTDQFAQIKPSFFEMTFALAMSWFENEHIDIAVIETGMGGRLDSTNVIKPILSVITNIEYDHMQFLGNSLKEIAYEKAGIIKEGIPIVIGESNDEIRPVFEERSISCNSEIKYADEIYSVQIIQQPPNPIFSSIIYSDSVTEIMIETPLLGDYQLKNIATVLTASKILEVNSLINNQALIKGIKNTIINTNLRGRWEILNTEPLTICDIGHNPHGISFIVNQLKKYKYHQLHFVLGVVNDKDITSMLELLPKNAVYYFCKADIPRGMETNILAEQAEQVGIIGQQFTSVMSAYKNAQRNAMSDDLIFVGGSAFVVAEILE